MYFTISFISLVASLLPLAQSAEQYPLLPTWKCTTSAGCIQQNTSVVLDTVSKNANNSPGSRTTADYTNGGVTTSGNAVTLYHYTSVNGQLTAASPRIYLLGADGKYVLMSLLNQEFTVTADFSTLPCGENGALYFSEMEAEGRATNGAQSGKGYCDAQCQGYCCSEMDILEANSRATAMTGHPCKGNTCDSGGCGFNPYASGQKNFWAPGGTINTNAPFTVVTGFVASGGTLTQITRKYIQNGQTIQSGTIDSCGDTGSTGGLSGMGAALGRGMVLALSIWNDASQNMAWLDQGANGPCPSGEGTPSNIQSRYPNTHVVFSNIRWGDIGSTTS